jgi:hypothetical protein
MYSLCLSVVAQIPRKQNMWQGLMCKYPVGEHDLTGECDPREETRGIGRKVEQEGGIHPRAHYGFGHFYGWLFAWSSDPLRKSCETHPGLSCYACRRKASIYSPQAPLCSFVPLKFPIAYIEAQSGFPWVQYCSTRDTLRKNRNEGYTGLSLKGSIKFHLKAYYKAGCDSTHM